MAQLTLAFDDFHGVSASEAKKAGWVWQTPEGANPRVGHCGIVACALATGRTVAATHPDIIRVAENLGYKRGTRWHRIVQKGGTNKRITDNYLWSKGVKFIESYPRGKTMKTACRALDPAKLYMVHMTGHVAMVHQGEILDQSAKKPIAEHWTARKRVSRIIEIQQ